MAVAKKEALPKLGATVLYRKSKTETRPMLVTQVGDDDFAGQVFGHGTAVDFVEGVTLGDDIGQASLSA